MKHQCLHPKMTPGRNYAQGQHQPSLACRGLAAWIRFRQYTRAQIELGREDEQEARSKISELGHPERKLRGLIQNEQMQHTLKELQTIRVERTKWSKYSSFFTIILRKQQGSERCTIHINAKDFAYRWLCDQQCSGSRW
jgi:hypothetical protein